MSETKALDLVTKRHSPFCNCAASQSAGTVCSCFTDEAAAELEELHNCIDKLEGELAAEVSKNIKLRSELDDVREAIEYIGQRSNFQIPSYAYSDNEAATYMASYLNEIDQIASAFLKAHPEVTK
jgi:hypothetical protein